MKVGLHQGSALSSLLFVIIMDMLAEEARTKPPWAMLFVDNFGARERNGRGRRGRTGNIENRYREQGVEK